MGIALNILVSGTSRGIGLEFTRQYLARGERVFAGCRNPDAAENLKKLQDTYPKTLTILGLDTGDAKSIQRAHAVLFRQADHLDLLINNAGIYSTRLGVPSDPGASQELGQLTQGDALLFFQVNTVGPLLIVQEFLNLLRQGTHAKIVNITSGYGSVSGNTSGFPYYYAASKAALNMITRSLAANLRSEGITTIVMSPGWVRTEMGGSSAPTLPEESVAGMIQVIDKLTLKQTGQFFNWQGATEAW